MRGALPTPCSACACRVSVHVFPPAVIDRDGLHRTNLRGLRAALTACQPADCSLVDGFRLGPTAPPHRAVVDGDEKSAAIAAASIVAKVTRDRYMHTVDAVYPGLRVLVARRVHHARAQRGRATGWAVGDPPPFVERALLRGRGRRRTRRDRSLGTPPSAAPRGGTACGGGIQTVLPRWEARDNPGARSP